MIDAKLWYQSKTLWFNVLVTVVAVADFLSSGTLVPAAWLPYLAAGVGIINVILRVWFTNQPITK